jgi:predicted nucleotidyltransferase
MANETGPPKLPPRAHTKAAEAFVDRTRSRFSDDIDELYVFGSTVRGDADGLASDVDVLVVLDDDVDRAAMAEELRDIALDVMIEYGPVVELHVLSDATFTRYRREGNPFIRNVISQGQSYV